jgi:16S rRNA (cytosine1407-C5)-methyltransferase
MLIAHAIKAIKDNLPKNSIALDLCAAPGGKSTLLDQELPPESLIIANEIIPKRAHILRENVLRWGSHRIRVTNNHPAEIGRLESTFQFILVDAPCSGEGMFRKDEVARTEWTIESGALCSARQSEILEDIWPALAPGGYLLYSTCTFDRLENLDAWENLDAEVINLKLPESWGVEKIGRPNQFGYQCFPDRVKGEGFFFTLLKKPGSSENTEGSAISIQNKQVLPWLSPEIQTTVFGDKLFGSLAMFNSPEMRKVKQLNYLLRETPIAVKKGNDWKPETPLAWSKSLPLSLPEFELTRDEALEYLHGQDIRNDFGVRGYVVLTYRAVRLGFGKQVNGRVNNLYAKSFRLRKSPNELKGLPLPW